MSWASASLCASWGGYCTRTVHNLHTSTTQVLYSQSHPILSHAGIFRRLFFNFALVSASVTENSSRVDSSELSDSYTRTVCMQVILYYFSRCFCICDRVPAGAYWVELSRESVLCNVFLSSAVFCCLLKLNIVRGAARLFSSRSFRGPIPSLQYSTHSLSAVYAAARFYLRYRLGS